MSNGLVRVNGLIAAELIGDDDDWRDPERIAHILRQSTVDEAWAGLEAYVTGEFTRRRREKVRQIEDAAEAAATHRWLAGATSRQRQRFAIKRRDPYAALRDMIQERAEDMILDLTPELLTSDLALGDGRKVTWGDATAADLQSRVDFLLASISGTADTVARLMAAIGIIRARGVTCLNDCLAVAA